ncbi:MAG: phosphotyrosine protein phosphatase [Henriciella sp.]|uniref:low molecular weight protein tyrosine phosphatase family protein n=1 Tax=Henriciella sp. TaxID=1968823 RepID=UPI003C70D0D1
MADGEPVRVLFVCSRNRLRSPTAEAVFNTVEGVEARSAGTAGDADWQITLDDIQWADLILAMENKHANRLKADFRQAVAYKTIGVLAIPDDYKYMQEDLVELLRQRVMPLIRASE